MSQAFFRSFLQPRSAASLSLSECSRVNILRYVSQNSTALTVNIYYYILDSLASVPQPNINHHSSIKLSYDWMISTDTGARSYLPHRERERDGEIKDLLCSDRSTICLLAKVPDCCNVYSDRSNQTGILHQRTQLFKREQMKRSIHFPLISNFNCWKEKFI